MEVGRDVKSVIKYWMEGEITNFIKIWILAYISLSYCYFVSKLVQKGPPRLFSLLPVVFLFFLIPLNLHSINLGGTTGFFLAWLANFKLLLLAFGHGPLSLPSISLPRFLALACFPINVHNSRRETSAPSSHNPHFQESPHQNGDFQDSPNSKFLEKHDLYPQNGTSQETPHQRSLENLHLFPQNGAFQETPNQESFEKSDLYYPQNSRSFKQRPHKISLEKSEPTSKNGNLEFSKTRKKLMIYAIKGLLLGFMLGVYNYSEQKHPKIMTLPIYFIHIYIYLEIIQAIMAAMTSGILGLELEPQFKDPYFSSSLQNFWGGRWNLMVNRILRPTVYNPVLRFSTNLFGRKWAAFPAVVSTFAVSGLMHELMFYYLGRVKPTWEITMFFVLHGSFLAMEIAVKKKLNGRYQLPRLLAASLSVGFVIVTGFWLFFPQLLRCQADSKALAEYANVILFLKDFRRALTPLFE